jgi:hypothetical protein
MEPLLALMPDEPSHREPTETQLQDLNIGLDWFLQNFVFLANRLEIQLALTLHTHGLLVSGNLISGRQYMNRCEAELNAGGANGSFAAVFDAARNNAYPEVDRELPLAPGEANPSFVHLKDARFFHNSGEPIPANQSVLWRGRISEISGFSFGFLSED